jgi:hypothetical protein
VQAYRLIRFCEITALHRLASAGRGCAKSARRVIETARGGRQPSHRIGRMMELGVQILRDLQRKSRIHSPGRKAACRVASQLLLLPMQ